MPLTPAAIAQERLREELADQLERLAEGLASARVLSREEWQEHRLALGPQARRVEELIAQAMDARRGNWRSRAGRTPPTAAMTRRSPSSAWSGVSTR